MTTKLAGAFVGAALAIGILVGAAGTVLVHDPSGRAALADMDQMHQTMSGAMGTRGMESAGSMDSADHARHHAAGTR